MTHKEMTEIFSVMMLAWPNAEMFKGGVQKLKPTIDLWTACLVDVDFWTAQQATVKLCKVRDFPPTIAAFREQVEEVNKDVKARIGFLTDRIRLLDRLGKSLQEIYEEFGEGEYQQVIDMIGGPENLVRSWEHNGETVSAWNWEMLENAYAAYLRKTTALPGTSHKALPSGKDKA